jgi:drug/metabolite transporter (DMT)-like permease
MTRRGLLLFALLSLLWGIPYLLIKLAVAEVSVPFLVFARAAVGALALLPFALAQGSFGWLKTQWLAVASFCVVEMVLPWGLIAHGEVSIDSSTAGLLIAMTPAVTVALSKLMGSDEQLGIRRWLGLFLGFAGVFVLALPTLGGGLLAVIEILLAAACYALGSIIASRWLNDVPASALTAVCLIGAAVIYAVPAAQAWPTVMPSMTAVSAIVSLGVFCTAIAFATYFLLVREIGPERAVVITYVAPAVSVAAGVLVLSEPLDIGILVAFALILCGSYLGTWRAPQEQSVSATTAS